MIVAFDASFLLYLFAPAGDVGTPLDENEKARSKRLYRLLRNSSLDGTAMTPLLVWAIAAGSVATKAVAILLFALATGLFVEATRRHTRGGAWRWRWGKDD